MIAIESIATVCPGILNMGISKSVAPKNLADRKKDKEPDTAYMNLSEPCNGFPILESNHQGYFSWFMVSNLND